MPVTTTEFAVSIPRERLWSLLNDFKTLGKCIPGCEEVQVLSPEESRWKLKLSVGVISRRVEAKVQIIERSEQERVLLKIDSLDGTLTGTCKLELSEQTPDSTKVMLVADMKASGSFEWVMNQIIKTQLGKMTSQFADCITKAYS